MAIVKQVVHGQVTLDDTMTSADVTLSTAIDMSKSFLVFGIEASDDAPEEDTIAGQILDTLTLRFERTLVEVGDNPVTIRYHLVEFESGVSVQRGVLNGTLTGNNDITLTTAVNPQKSMVLVSLRMGGTAFTDEEWVRATLPLSDTLRLFLADGDAQAVVPWQVIEFTDSAVQSGTVDFTVTDTVKTVTLATTVDPDKSWLTLSYSSDTGTQADIGQKMVRGELSTDGTTLTFTRENSGQIVNLAYFLIEFTDNTVVQRGTTTLSTSELEKIIPLTDVDPDHSIPVAAGIYDTAGSTSFSDDDMLGVAMVRMSFLGNGDSLAIRRGTVGDPTAVTATIPWQVIEFEGQSTGGTGGTGGSGGSISGVLPQEWIDTNDSLRMQFTDLGQVQIGDFDAGVLSTQDALIEAHREESSDLPERGIHTLGHVSGAISTAISWLVGELVLMGTAAISSIHAAVRGRVTHSSTGDSSNAELRAGDFEVINQSGTSGTPVGAAVGVQATVDNQANAHLVKASGVVAQIQNATGADIETAAAFEVAPPVNDGTIDTLIGLDVPDMSEGSVDNYAIRTGLGTVHLGDVVEIPQQTYDPADKANVMQIYAKDSKLFAKLPDPSNTIYNLTSITQINEANRADGAVLKWDENGQYIPIAGVSPLFEGFTSYTGGTTGTYNDLYLICTNLRTTALIIKSVAIKVYAGWTYTISIRSHVDGSIIASSNSLSVVDETVTWDFTDQRVVIPAGAQFRIQLTASSNSRIYNRSGTTYTYANLSMTKTWANAYAPVAYVESVQAEPNGTPAWKENTLAELIDVDLSTPPTNEQVLVWNNSSSVFEPMTPSLSHSVADISNPPTKSEITSALGDPSTLPDGYQGIIDDAGTSTNVWLCTVSQGEWWYEAQTKAI